MQLRGSLGGSENGCLPGDQALSIGGSMQSCSEGGSGNRLKCWCWIRGICGGKRGPSQEQRQQPARGSCPPMSPAGSVSTTATFLCFCMTWTCVHFSPGHRDALGGGRGASGIVGTLAPTWTLDGSDLASNIWDVMDRQGKSTEAPLPDRQVFQDPPQRPR